MTDNTPKIPRPEIVAYAIVRHMIGLAGYGVCGHTLGTHSGGEHGADLPNVYWEEDHRSMPSVGLLIEVTSGRVDSVCRPCALYAVEQLQEHDPDLVPAWASTEPTLLAALEGSWEPYSIE